WRNEASNNMAILKSAFKNRKTQSHDHIYAKLCEVKVDDSLQNDLLCIGVIDFSSDRYQLSGNNYKDLVREKADIRELTKSARIKKLYANFVVGRNEFSQLCKFVLLLSEMVTYDQWVEEEYEKECVVRGIIDVLLQEIKLNVLYKVTHGSENSLVEIIARLIDTAMYRLPVGYEIEITRAERQSIASKNRKKEIVYLKSGKWNCDNEKICNDHNKLVQFCLDGTEELFKICEKGSLNKNYIGFIINIAVAGDLTSIAPLIAEISNYSGQIPPDK
ncbi:15740_t:CDS:2, partial [Racocetra persica]